MRMLVKELSTVSLDDNNIFTYLGYLFHYPTSFPGKVKLLVSVDATEHTVLIYDFEYQESATIKIDAFVGLKPEVLKLESLITSPLLEE